MTQAHPAIDLTAYKNARKKYLKNACTSLPEDEHLDVRNNFEDNVVELNH